MTGSRGHPSEQYGALPRLTKHLTHTAGGHAKESGERAIANKTKVHSVERLAEACTDVRVVNNQDR